MSKDKRPDPKPRKNPLLWQTYTIYDELERFNVRMSNRISSCEKGKSSLSVGYWERWQAWLGLDVFMPKADAEMIEAGEALGPIWSWTVSIKGLGSGRLNAKLLAQIDDIGAFDTISKLWRFAGYAVIDGKREWNQRGEKSHYNRKLKAICYNIGNQFIIQQTPVYSDIYYQEKARLRELYPEPVAIPNPPKGSWNFRYTDSHIHRMARRKMIKIFLQHLWVKWREFEGLAISEPWIIAQGGHANYLAPHTDG